MIPASFNGQDIHIDSRPTLTFEQVWKNGGWVPVDGTQKWLPITILKGDPVLKVSIVGLHVDGERWMLCDAKLDGKVLTFDRAIKT